MKKLRGLHFPSPAGVISALAAVAFCLFSCTTPSETSGSGDCLLLIPTEYVREAGTDPVRSYYIKFSHLDREFEIPQSSSDVLAVRLNSPADTLKSVTSRVTNPNFKGKDFQTDYDLTLPYRSGAAVISNFRLSMRVELEGGKTVTRFFLDTLSGQERLDILNRLKSEGFLEP